MEIIELMIDEWILCAVFDGLRVKESGLKLKLGFTKIIIFQDCLFIFIMVVSKAFN